MIDTKCPLMEVAEALQAYRPILPRSLASRAGFYKAVARGDIPSIRIGRRIYVIRAKLEALLHGETPPHPPTDGQLS